MRKSWRCGTKHAVITPITVVHTRLVWWTHINVENSLCGVNDLFSSTKHICFSVITTDGCKNAQRTILPSLVTKRSFQGVRHRHHRSSYKACVRVLRLQSTLISNLCTHGVGTKHIPTWWELIPFFYLIIPKSRLIVHKNGVIKKKNGGSSHHPVRPLMFWYQHLL